MESKVEILCREKEKELLEKYFPYGSGGNKAETIGEYTKDLPLKIENEFREFLVGVWKEYSDKPLVLEEEKLRSLMTENKRLRMEEAYKDAEKISLWEKITKSNNRDVIYYKGLLYEYTKEVLTIMRLDFLEEITGRHIENKTF